MRTSPVVWWCAALLLNASPMAAQSRGYDFEVSAGLAPTTQALVGSAPVAAVMRFGVVQRSGERAYRFRLDGDAVFAASGSQAGSVGALRAAGVSYGVLVGKLKRAVAPYAMAGIGVAMVAGQGDGWPGTRLTARTGAGVRWRASGRQLFAELSVVSGRSSSSVLSQHALMWPVTLGIAF